MYKVRQRFSYFVFSALILPNVLLKAAKDALIKINEVFLEIADLVSCTIFNQMYVSVKF